MGSHDAVTSMTWPVGVHFLNTPASGQGLYPNWTPHTNLIQTDLDLKRPVDLLFCGDSITRQFLDPYGTAIWTQYYGSRKVLNMGVGGDVTQGLLYRLTALGHLRRIRPKLAVLMIGTNNSIATEPFVNARQMRDGIFANAQAIRRASPSTKVLIMGILPRDTPGMPTRVLCDATNALVAADPYIDGVNVMYQSLNSSFVDGSGNVIPALYIGDALHPSEAGYAIWAAAIEPTVASVLGASATETFVADIVQARTTTVATGQQFVVELPNLLAAGEAPKVVFLRATGGVDNGADPESLAEARDVAFSNGWAVSGASQYAYGFAIDSAAATSATGRARSVDNTAALIHVDPAGVIDGKLAVVDMTTPGQVGFLVNDGFPENVVFEVEAWGGTGVYRSSLTQYTRTNALTNFDVTTGHVSRYVENMGFDLGSAVHASTKALLSIGRAWVPTVANHILTISSDHASAAANSSVYAFDGDFYGTPLDSNPGTVMFRRHAVVAGLGNGFTLARLAEGGANTTHHCVSVEGSFQGAFGTIASGMDSAAPIVLAPGFTTRLYDFWSGCKIAGSANSAQAQASASLGWVEKTSGRQHALSWIDPDAADPTAPGVGYTRGGVYQELSAASAVVGKMTFSSGDTFAMATPAPAARFAMWAAYGDAVSPAVVTSARRFIDVGVQFESATVALQDGMSLDLTSKVRVLWDDTTPNIELYTTILKVAETISQRTG